MRAIFAALVASVMMTFGCKALPDGDDLDRLRERLAGIPIGIKMDLHRWAANRVAYGYCLKTRGNGLGTLFCANVSAKDPGGEHIPVEMERMLKCLHENQTVSYFECLNIILEDIEGENLDKNYSCDWIGYSPGMEPDEVPPEFRSDRISDDDLVEALTGIAPPPLEIQLLLMRVPGFVGPKGAICAQGVDWACADNPLEGAPPTTSASSGGGDR